MFLASLVITSRIKDDQVLRYDKTGGEGGVVMCNIFVS
jgi:hypothetical protein